MRTPIVVESDIGHDVGRFFAGAQNDNGSLRMTLEALRMTLGLRSGIGDAFFKFNKQSAPQGLGDRAAGRK